MTEETMIARKEGRAGRLTFNRPKALNALDHDMAMAIEAALDRWRDDPEVDLVVIDAVGDRAFCSGGDIAAVYRAGIAGDYAPGRDFWRDEYRMNAKIAEYPKPIVAFMQGFVMGGGVGVGGHASHRIVGESTQVAMPESGIGLIPDVGGTLLLARAPGHVGEYLGLTGARMNATDALYAGFADMFVPEADWDDLKTRLIETGNIDILPHPRTSPEPGKLESLRPEIDRIFWAENLAAIVAKLETSGSEFAEKTYKTVLRNSALSMEATLRLIRMTRAENTIRAALTQEFRFTWRAAELGDFLEGVRAQIIDKDRNPQWKYALDALPEEAVAQMLEPLGPEWAIWEETP
ncbi:enoyl-CoA hydratase [Thioclava sediminum]|uniref:3-hydroxyisobutyryl-CoA hydrolase n=1 Tax=Thioclava sediminum TaxID=1915319 RepID=A0ABX3N0Y9_9RHOB|nr:enoyl-CoA hydratase/isomerase family protein [Thioclava sediminum]OOY25104.1 enoyl-CoA hydratase [Thioclava sediminum]